MTPTRVIGIGETVLDILFKDDQPQKAEAFAGLGFRRFYCGDL